MSYSVVRKGLALTSAAALVSFMGVASANAEEAVPDSDLVDASVAIDGNSASLTGPDGGFSLLLPSETSSASRSAPTVQYEIIDNGMTVVTSSTLDAAGSPAFALQLPADATAQELVSDSGVVSIIITDVDGQLVGGLAPLESIDASGEVVTTTMRLDGGSVTQEIVDDGAVTFPVTARAASSTV